MRLSYGRGAGVGRIRGVGVTRGGGVVVAVGDGVTDGSDGVGDAVGNGVTVEVAVTVGVGLWGRSGRCCSGCRPLADHLDSMYPPALARVARVTRHSPS